MARFFKGAGVGTYWHSHDPRAPGGLSARYPHGTKDVHAIIQHIARLTVASPYISLTKSFGVAEAYALEWSIPAATSKIPAYVYEIDLPDPVPQPTIVLDPIFELAQAHNNPLANITYHHDGDMNFLLGVVDRKAMSHHLWTPIRQPPGSGGTSKPAILTQCLEAMVRALRDAEVLVIGGVPPGCVLPPHEVH
jgi:hypothetical protein